MFPPVKCATGLRYAPTRLVTSPLSLVGTHARRKGENGARPSQEAADCIGSGTTTVL